MKCVKTDETITVRLLINVRYANNTYITERVIGESASCTAGPVQAAQRVAQKVFGNDARIEVTTVVPCCGSSRGMYEAQVTYRREVRK